MLILPVYFIFNVNYVNQVNDKCVVAGIIKKISWYECIYVLLHLFDIQLFRHPAVL